MSIGQGNYNLGVSIGWWYNYLIVSIGQGHYNLGINISDIEGECMNEWMNEQMDI